ncbi:MAG: hypothetical protein Q4F57_10005, partial [Weeksellaceae bacterium]|nr:hypothetical protein [Weeksellaceae bacterium]
YLLKKFPEKDSNTLVFIILSCFLTSEIAVERACRNRHGFFSFHGNVAAKIYGKALFISLLNFV